MGSRGGNYELYVLEKQWGVDYKEYWLASLISEASWAKRSNSPYETMHEAMREPLIGLRSRLQITVRKNKSRLFKRAG